MLNCTIYDMYLQKHLIEDNIIRRLNCTNYTNFTMISHGFKYQILMCLKLDKTSYYGKPFWTFYTMTLQITNKRSYLFTIDTQHW